MDGLISIIVPVYNVADYLDECISSLINQTYRNLEILLIDDGSTDGSGTICDVWAEKDERIRVIHTENHGVSHARNIGLKEARGGYIGFVDGDDWCDPDMYETMLNYVHKTKADIHAGGYVIERAAGTEMPLHIGTPGILSVRQAIHDLFSPGTHKRFMNWVVWDKLFSRSIISGIRFDEKLKRSEDQWFFWQVLRRVNCISYAPQMAYHYRIREGSAMHTVSNRVGTDSIAAMKYILQDAEDMDRETKHLLEMRYWQMDISLMKDIILSGIHHADGLLAEQQNALRSHGLACMKEPGLSKLGVLYFCLPCCLVWKLRPLLVVREEGVEKIMKNVMRTIIRKIGGADKNFIGNFSALNNRVTFNIYDGWEVAA